MITSPFFPSSSPERIPWKCSLLILNNPPGFDNGNRQKFLRDRGLGRLEYEYIFGLPSIAPSHSAVHKPSSGAGQAPSLLHWNHKAFWNYREMSLFSKPIFLSACSSSSFDFVVVFAKRHALRWCFKEHRFYYTPTYRGNTPICQVKKGSLEEKRFNIFEALRPFNEIVNVRQNLISDFRLFNELL